MNFLSFIENEQLRLAVSFILFGALAFTLVVAIHTIAAGGVITNLYYGVAGGAIFGLLFYGFYRLVLFLFYKLKDFFHSLGPGDE